MMKLFRNITILFFIIHTSCGKEEVIPTTDNFESYSVGSWQLTKMSNQLDQEYVMHIAFGNDNVGFFTEFHEIYKTTDAGNTWEKLDSITHFHARDIQFLDENVGFISGNSVVGAFPTWGRIDGILLKTLDGGTTWTYIIYPPRREFSSSNPDYLDQILFLTELEGMALIDEIQTDWENKENRWFLGYTKDGGESWTNLGLTTISNQRDIKRVDNSIYFLADDISFHKSDDNGKNWTTRTIPIDKVKQLFFVNNKIGYASDGYILLKTTNGGETWDQLSFNFTGTEFIHFISDTEGIILDYPDGTNWTFGGRGIYMRTTSDGGITWTTSDLIEDISFIQPSFPDGQIGFSAFRKDFYILKHSH